MTLRYFPIAFDSFKHHADLEAAAEVEAIGRVLEEFGAHTVDWDVPTEQRGRSAASDRLIDLENVPEPCDTFVYWLGHGAINGLSVTLACADSPQDVGAHGIVPEVLASAIARSQEHRLAHQRWTIVVVEACRSAQFVRLLASALDRHSSIPRRLLLVGVSGEGSTRLGKFRETLEHIVENTFKACDIPLHDLVAELERTIPDATVRTLDLGDGALRRRSRVPSGVTMDVFTQLKAMLADLEPDKREHFIPKAQGAELGEVAWYFEGREQERREISHWLRAAPGGLLVVTGPAGSGKSALLGHLVEQSQPELRKVLIAAGLTTPVPETDRPPDDVFDAVVHLSGMTVAGVVGELADRLGLAAPNRRSHPLVQAEEFAQSLVTSGLRRTVLLDALDEAQEPLVLARELVRRLAGLPGIRVVVGTRSSTMETPDRQGPVDDDLLEELGTCRLVAIAPDPAAVTRYVAKRLRARLGDDPAILSRVAGVSERIGGSFRQFLFARLAVHEVLAEPGLIDDPATLEALLGNDHRDLFAAAVRRLTVREPAYGALLAALGQAKGRGLPILDGLWLKVAKVLHPEVRIVDRHIDELLEQAAPYLMVNVEHGQTVFRLAHATFVEHYRQDQAGQLKMFDALIDIAERNLARDLNPYLQAYLAEHTAEAGPAAWHKLAQKPWTLDRLDPTAVAVNAMRTLFGRGPVPPEIAGVIGAQHHLAELSPGERLGYRQLAMARYGGVNKPAGYKPNTPSLVQWSVPWAQLEKSPIHLVLSDKSTEAKALAVFNDVSGRTLIAVGGKHLQVCDPGLGQIVGQTRRPAAVSALAALTEPDGRTLLVSGHTDGQACFWDPAEIVRGGEPDHVVQLGAVSTPISAIATFTTPEGRDLLALTSGTVISVYDPAGHGLVARSDVGLHRRHSGLAVARQPEGDIVISYGLDGIVRSWKLDAEGLVSQQIGGSSRSISALVVLDAINGRHHMALAINSQSMEAPQTLEVRNVSGSRVSQHTIRGTGIIRHLAATTLPDGRALVAAAGSTGVVAVWEIPYDHAKAALMTGHTERVRAVTMVPAADGRPLIASTGPDGTVRLWDPSTDDGSPSGRPAPFLPPSGAVVLRDKRRRLIVTRGREAGLHLWDPKSGYQPTRIAEELRGVDSLAVLPNGPAGRQLIAASSSSRHAVQVWDVFAEPESAHGVKPGYRLLLASGSADGTVRIWDPETGSPIGSPLTGTVANDAGITRLANIAGPHGDHLLIAARTDGTVLIWDPRDHQLVGRPITAASGRIQALTAFTVSDGRAAVAVGGGDGEIRIWDALTGELIARPPAGHATAISALTAFAGPDGSSWLASAGADGGIRIWQDVMNGGESRPIPHKTGRVLAFAAFTNRDGALLLATGEAAGPVRIWDPVTGEPHGAPLTGHSGAVLDLAAYPVRHDATELASAGADGTIRVWDVYNAQSAAPPMRDPSGSVLGLTRLIGRDGRVLLAGAGTDHVIRVWDTASGLVADEISIGHEAVRALEAFPIESELRDYSGPDPALAPQLIASRATGAQQLVSVVSQRRPALALVTSASAPQIWDLAGSDPASPIKATAQAVAPLRDESGRELLAVADGRFVRLFDADTLAEISTVCSHDMRVDLLIGVSAAAGPPSLITATSLGQLVQWDLSGGVVSQLGYHARQVRAALVRNRPDGEPVLVSGGGDGKILVWSLVTSRIRQTIQLQTAVRDLSATEHGVLVATDLGLVELALPLVGHR